MKSAQDIIAVTGSILAIITTLLAIIRGFRDLRRSTESAASGENVTAQKVQLDSPALDDLGITLLVGALLGVIAIDALIVPYFSASIGWVSSVAALLCGISIIGLLVMAWKARIPYFAISIVSGFLLIMRTISISWSFEKSGLLPGLMPTAGLIEVCVLLFLCTLSLHHLLEPFIRRESDVFPRIVSLAFLAMPLLLTTAAVSDQFMLSAKIDPRAPGDLSPEGRNLIDDLVSNGSQDAIVNLYRLASETASEGNYLEAANKSFSETNRFTEKNPTGEALTPLQAEILSRLSDRAPKQPVLISTITPLFDLQSISEKIQYLSARLQWVYPASSVKEHSSPLSLPGSDIRTRFTELSDTRIQVALSTQRQIRDEFLGSGLRYSEIVMSTFGKINDDSPMNSVKQMMGSIFGANNHMQSSILEAFPHRELSSFNAQFGAQISLPLSQEMAIAHREYRSFIRASLKSAEPAVAGFLNQIEELPEKDQLRLQSLIGLTEQPSILIDALSAMEGIELSPSLKIQGVTYLLKLADALRSHRGSGPNVPALDKKSIVINNFDQLQQQVLIRLTNQPDQRNILADILQREARSNATVTDLFSGHLPNIAKEITTSFAQQTRSKLIEGLAAPVRTSLLRLASDIDRTSAQYPIESKLKQINSMPAKEKEILLHHMALKVYRNEGEHALPPAKQVVLQASNVSKFLGYVVAFLGALPLAALIAGLALLAERALKARTTLSLGARADSVRILDRLLPKDSTKLEGRAEFLSRIERLINKCSSTIAFTGRRGGGKSALLRQIYRDAIIKKKISVWIDCPAKYGQEEFLRAMTEKLASAAESAAAKSIGIPNYNERSSELVRSTQTWNITLSLLLLIATIATSVIAQGSRSDAFALWIPLIPVVILGVAIIISGTHSTSSTPGFATVFAKCRNYDIATLFIRASGILRDLTHEGIRKEGLYAALTTLRAVGLTVLMLVILQQTISIAFYKEDTGILGKMLPLPSKVEQISVLGVTIILWSFIYLKKIEPPWIRRWNNLAMVELYRDLATEIVERARNSQLVTDGACVVVCIDELDKIIDQTELINLLKIIKPLLDIDGVVFYFSISDDALTSFRLGGISGKDIFDSTFDHIERLPPLTLESATLVAASYLRSIFSTPATSDINRLVAMLSFGVPRDIVRLCDEIKSNYEHTAILPKEVVQRFRLERVSAARASNILLQSEKRIMEGPADQARQFATELVLQDGAITRIRFFAAILIYIWLEEESQIGSRSLENYISVYEFGYEIPLLSGEEIARFLRNTATGLLNSSVIREECTAESESD